MTGSAADPPAYQQHLHGADVRRKLKARAKDPDDPLEIVIVRDMWLTGFDAQALHTMYVDKPMQGANLMQAIARVNRTFRDKPGGLIVDYIGVATNLRQALAEYSPTRPRSGRCTDRAARGGDVGEARHRPGLAARLHFRPRPAAAGR